MHGVERLRGDLRGSVLAASHGPRRELLIAKRYIEPIEAVGKPLDPTYHEAMMTQPHDDAPSGQVVQEVARGFRMHERVVRPARVIVSSGPAGDAERADSQES